MYCPEVYKQAKDMLLMVTAAFLLGRLYEKVKRAKAAIKNSEGDI